MGAIQFWLSWNNGAERIQLPVNPETIEFTSPFGYEDVAVSKLGEVTVIGERNLRELSFNSFFPASYSPVYCEYNGFKKPWDLVKQIEKWRDSRAPMRLTVTGTPINYAVTLRDFSYEAEKAGSPGDIYFSMSFKEFRFIQLKTVKKEPGKSTVKPTTPRPNTKTVPKTYTVVKGDSLWKIAQDKLGKGSRWNEIYALNKSVIGKNPNLIKPGQKLVLPS
jgi:nucleoid-associated protein YgaU